VRNGRNRRNLLKVRHTRGKTAIPVITHRVQRRQFLLHLCKSAGQANQESFSYYSIAGATKKMYTLATDTANGTSGGAFDSAKNHKRQSVTDKREKSQTPNFV